MENSRFSLFCSKWKFVNWNCFCTSSNTIGWEVFRDDMNKFRLPWLKYTRASSLSASIRGAEQKLFDKKPSIGGFFTNWILFFLEQIFWYQTSIDDNNLRSPRGISLEFQSTFNLCKLNRWFHEKSSPLLFSIWNFHGPSFFLVKNPERFSQKPLKNS